MPLDNGKHYTLHVSKDLRAFLALIYRINVLEVENMDLQESVELHHCKKSYWALRSALAWSVVI
eukprot:6462758-Amphidinium_carterae.2